MLAGDSHHSQGAEDVGEYRAPGRSGSAKGRISLGGKTVSMESGRFVK